jgi:hypothetical protein
MRPKDNIWRPKLSAKAEELRETIQKNSMRAGGSDGYIEAFRRADPVHVTIVFNVQSYGPHGAAIYADQGRGGTDDHSLQEAFTELETWELDHIDPKYQQELEMEHGENWVETVTETFEARSWTLEPDEFATAIEETDAEKFIDVTGEDPSTSAQYGEVFSDALQDLGLKTKGESTKYLGYILVIFDSSGEFVASLRFLDDGSATVMHGSRSNIEKLLDKTRLAEHVSLL